MTEFISLVGVSLVVMTIALFRLRWLMYVASLFWFFAGLWVRGLSVTANSPAGADWDIYYGMMFLSFFMVLVCALIPTAMRDKKEEEEGDVYVDDIDATEEYADKLNRATQIPKIGRRASEERRQRKQESKRR